MSRFKILHKDGKARVGKLVTAHGVIETPNFIPVGTQGTVKSLNPTQLKEADVQVVLANTYHLMLRPGVKVVRKFLGLHRFMGWSGPIMTDSGGFQVFSLGVALEHGVGKLLREGGDSETKPRLNKITEEGVTFQSHIDGSKQILTPEKSIDLQLQFGADLMVAFDDLESPKYSYEETLKSLELTERWEFRSKDRFTNNHWDVRPLLYGVTHGGIFKDLRVKSAKFVDQHFEGIALGGAHKDRNTLYQVVEWTVENISEQKPRHLLGIGEVQDLLECTERGIDLFDCAAPTRRARNGSLYVSPASGIYKSYKDYKSYNFAANISRGRFSSDSNPVDPTCSCYTCRNFSRAYLRHLFKASELLYHQLASVHNIHFIVDLMENIRKAIKKNRFEAFKKEWL